MVYYCADRLIFPLEKYAVNGDKFMQECSHNGMYWGFHLGEDINCPAGTRVCCAGDGKVVYSALHPGVKGNENWGNIIIVRHKNPHSKQVFYSLYGHLAERKVEKGQRVFLGQTLGTIGKAKTLENGWWEDEHLHFAIYTGPWKGQVLPGYWTKESKRTEPCYWHEPTKFIENYCGIK
jgi:murein DD-endopeptidase MepM/ murein hydrolase activator NlpD